MSFKLLETIQVTQNELPRSWQAGYQKARSAAHVFSIWSMRVWILVYQYPNFTVFSPTFMIYTSRFVSGMSIV